MNENFECEWEGQSKSVLQELKLWRLEHPKATLREIEAATDERLDRLRSRLVSDTATASERAAWNEVREEERPVCPTCRIPMKDRGSQKRRL